MPDASRCLSHTVDEMLVEHGIDPEVALVTDVQLVDGETLAVDTAAVDPVGEAVARAVLAGHGSDFAEVRAGEYLAAAFVEDGEPAVAVERDGEELPVELAGQTAAEAIRAAYHLGRAAANGCYAPGGDDA
jgi:hypothetical protein